MKLSDTVNADNHLDVYLRSPLPSLSASSVKHHLINGNTPVPEDVVTMIKNGYVEAALQLTSYLGVDHRYILNLNHNYVTSTRSGDRVYSSSVLQWFKNMGYKPKIESEDDGIYIFENIDKDKRYVKYIEIQVIKDLKSIKDVGAIASNYIDDKVPHTILICSTGNRMSGKLKNFYRDSGAPTNVFFVHVDFFKKEYNDHIFYPKVEILQTPGSYHKEVSYFSPYLFSARNAHVIKEFMFNVNHPASLSICAQFSSGHQSKIVDIEKYYISITR